MISLRFILEDWTIKLFSLGVALVLFLFVTVENSTPVDVDFRIDYRTADDMLITNDAPAVLHTTLQGPWAAFRTYDITEMVPIEVDLTQAGPGAMRHSITLTEIRAPGGMRVASMRPTELEVVLDRRIERQVAVHADIPDAPAFGYEVMDVRVVPPRVRVVGPGARMQTLEYISTRTIDIVGREQELSLEVDLRPPPPPLRLVDKRVTVYVDIAEEFVQRTLQNVPLNTTDLPKNVVLSPATVTFVLKGPRRIIDRLDPASLTARVELTAQDLAAQGPIERPVALAQDLPERTQLVAPVPRVTIAFTNPRKSKRRP
jgi:YbbR domain-containing protein